jgi:hypothetical protein
LQCQEISVWERNFVASKIKPDKVLPPATTEMVKQFYMSDEINRIMPRTTDYVSVI